MVAKFVKLIAMIQQTLEIQDATQPGTAYLAAPEQGGPAVLVLHAWWGLTPVFKRVCDRLAEAGFVALAPDLYAGRTVNTIPEAEALLQQGDSAFKESMTLASAKLLRAHPLNVSHGKIGVIGFSMGAAWLMWLAGEGAPEDIAAGVLFYGMGESENFTSSGPALQGHFALGDEFEPDEGINQAEANLRKAGVPVEFFRYEGVGHWFFEDDRPEAYNAVAAQQAWDRTLAFLRDHLK